MVSWRDIMKENVEDLFSPNLWLSIPSEMLGALVITLVGCSTWLSWTPMSPLHTALAFGLAVATVVWIFAHISGGHANPAVTLAALFTRRVSIIRGILYIVSQIVGGILGAGILYGLSEGAEVEGAPITGELGVNKVRAGLSSAQGFGVECIVTFVFVLTFFASQDDKRCDLRGSSPLTIGLAAVACHLFAIPATSAGMNPARSFGPALIADSWEHHWVFWVGPLVGGLAAGLVYEYIFAAGATFAGAKKCLIRTKKPRAQPAPAEEEEKTPLEEVKSDGIEMDESKLSEAPEKGDEVVEIESEEKEKLLDDSKIEEAAKE